MPSSDHGSDKKTKGNDVILTENTDDFIIGDRVWVNGTKPGYIQYLGDTRFGPGEWAGVVLDDHSGKNDGSVSGIRYFQCEPKRGVFARLHKLTRFPLAGTASPVGSNGGSRSGSSSPLPSVGLRCSTPTRAVSPSLLSSVRPRIGDRIVVNTSTGGTKAGFLRYIGTTDFAAGEWAGVELDEPTGKNDGTVAGKKYFDCPKNCGLFAPAHKVSKVTGSAASRRFQQHHHHGSHDSLNSSLSSRASESGRIEERKEEDEDDDDGGHRQSRRNESQPLSPDAISKAASQFEQVQNKLSQLQQEHRRYVDESEKRANRLRQLLDAAEAERKTLNLKLDKERRKVEELQFRVDEECISKDDLELQTQREKTRIEELEARLQEEAKKNQVLSDGKSVDAALEELVKKQQEECSSLRQQLREAKKQVQSMKSKIEGDEEEETHHKFKTRSFEEELTRREEQLLQMQVTLDNKKRELNSLQSRVSELEKELEKYKSRQERHIATIDNLNVQLQKSESQINSLNEELHLAKQKTSDGENRLALLEEKCREMTKEREKMRDQISEVVAHDQISATLNKELKDKDKELVEMERRLSEFIDREQRLRDEHLSTQRSLAAKYQEEIRSWKDKVQRLEQQVSDKERRSFKEDEMEKQHLKRELDKRESALRRLDVKVEEETQRFKDEMERMRSQINRLQVEKERYRCDKEEVQKRLEISEERRRHAEEEREAHVSALKSEVHRLRTEFTSHKEDLIKKLAENQFETKMAEELQEQIEGQRQILEEVQRRLRTTQGERDQLNDELLNVKMDSERQHQQLETKNSAMAHELEVVKKR